MTKNTNETKYNGFKNYSTWVASLWLKQDEGDLATVQSFKTPDELQAFIADRMDEATDTLPGLFVDLLQAQYQEIDFTQVFNSTRSNN